jgi:hypothetical protein
MRFESLSATLNKKDEQGNPLPNIVKVSNTVYNKESTPEGQTVQPLEIKFPAELMSYPQFDTLEEFITDCGGSDRALEVVNDLTQKFATGAGKTSIRTATVGSEEEIVEAGCKASREFSWKAEQKLSTKEKANAFDILLAEKDKLTPEQLLARVMELAGK